MPDGATIAIPAVPPSAVVDPTGCGDAYRAGLLYGIAQGWDWEKTGRLASVLGALKIARAAGRTTPSTASRSAPRYREQFGAYLW